MDRSTLRSAYLYLVCLITFVMVVFAAVSAVRDIVGLAYPDRTAFVYEQAYGPNGPKELTATERQGRQDAALDSQRRSAVLGLVGSGAMLAIAGPAYLYHWRRVQAELRTPVPVPA